MRLPLIIFLLFFGSHAFAQVDSLQNADSISFILKPKPIYQHHDTTSHCSILYCKKGIASYYGRSFHGRMTSSGERFNMNKLTAAHKTLPFGTLLVVTNLKNKKAIIVRVNDRMPLSNKREIDLSLAAAQQLDYVATGLATVQLEIYKSK
ncbi:MAG: septal ring lytic transglycosylase RlpA family protein [Bacteroidetes bacterium]|nr:septal ring lytic transglycosylase RlpA family protein [Bacteroidota bacterium]